MTEISQEEIKQAIGKIKSKKAPGPDELGNEVWIYGGAELREKLRELLNEILRGGPISDGWKSENLEPIFKKGD